MGWGWQCGGVSPDPTIDALAARAAELDAEIRGARLQTLHAAWTIDQHGAKAARDEIAAIRRFPR